MKTFDLSQSPFWVLHDFSRDRTGSPSDLATSSVLRLSGLDCNPNAFFSEILGKEFSRWVVPKEFARS